MVTARRLRTRPTPLLALVLVLISGCSEAPRPVQEGFIALSGGDQAHYRLIGQGPDTVVFLAGGPAFGSRYLEEGLRRLGQTHALLFYDYRGRGGSSVARSTDSLRLTVDVGDLELIRSHFGLRRLRLVAHHWGAAVALQYGLRHPDRIDRVVLLSPFAHKGDFLWELAYLPNDSTALTRHDRARAARLESADPAGYCRDFWGFALSPVEVTDPRVVRRLAPAICDAPPERLMAREEIQRHLYATFGTWDWVDAIPRFASPTLVIVGAGEPALVAGARAWAGRLPESRLLVAGATPHFPWLEAEPQVVAAIDGFFLGLWPDAGVHVLTPPDTVMKS